MPQFTTISPTHIPGKKEYAWRNFRKGGYVAIGWLEATDLSGKTIKEIELLLEDEYSDEPDRISRASRAFDRFLSLRDGDYVAVPNVNFGIFGVGIIASDYKFEKNMHDIGSGNTANFYSHCREVRWVVKDYKKVSEILVDNDKSWEPFGTIGKVQSKVPPYIARLVGLPAEKALPLQSRAEVARPEFLTKLIGGIQALRKDSDHQERDHEALVHDFFVSLGYERYADIKFRRGRIDLTIAADGFPLAIVEVKRVWDLDYEGATEHIQQAYRYAHETGVRYVLITNGDDYLFFDRLKGLSWETNLLGEWKLSALRGEDLKLIDRLRPERLRKPDLMELFQHLSEAFGRQI